jgi:hypothetical protein
MCTAAKLNRRRFVGRGYDHPRDPRRSDRENFGAGCPPGDSSEDTYGPRLPILFESQEFSVLDG